jgi:HD-like signal output (HDOD) protein
VDTQQRIDEFIRSASRLPAFPSSLARLVKAMETQDRSADDLAQIIESDAALAARLLKVANSSFYGRTRSVSSVRQAVVVLGNRTVRSLALAVWTHTFNPKAGVRADAATQVTLFCHGIATAVISKQLAARLDPALSEDAFLAGLLHDIGRVALVFQLGRRYRESTMERCSNPDTSLLDVEREVLGFDHAQLGSTLMQSWKLPSFLADVAAMHHAELNSVRASPVLCAVAYGDYLALESQPNVAPQSLRPDRDALRADFRLDDEEELEAMIADCRDQFNAFTAAMP